MSALVPRREALPASAGRDIQNLTVAAGHAKENLTIRFPPTHDDDDGGAPWRGLAFWSRNHTYTSLGAPDCSAHTDCSGCLEQEGEANSRPCFWCFDTQTCQSVSVTDLVLFDAFSGCKEILLDADQCKCQPTVYTSCSECAQALHPTCVWMEEAMLTTTIRYQPPVPALSVEQISAKVRLGGRCVDGSGFGASDMSKNVTLFKSDIIGIITAAYEVEPGQWFWAQCALPAKSLAGVIVGSVLLLMACVIAVTCYSCRTAGRPYSCPRK